MATSLSQRCSKPPGGAGVAPMAGRRGEEMSFAGAGTVFAPWGGERSGTGRKPQAWLRMLNPSLT